MQRIHQLLRLAGLVAVAASTLVACGGDGDSNPPPPSTQATPVATDDSISLLPGQTASVLVNDTLDGAAAVAGSGGNVSYASSGTLPDGVTVTDGQISLDDTVVAGDYSFSYQVCSAGTASCDSAQVTLTIPAFGFVVGRTLDAATGAVIADVSVTLGQTDGSTTSDANGVFRVATPVTDRLSVVFAEAAHIETSRITRVLAGDNTVDVRMLPYAADVTLPIADGGVATVPNSVAQVSLPANAVVRADGSAATGNMRVLITPIAPATDTGQMPGDYQTLVNGTLAPLQSWGAMNVRLFDESDNELQLASGVQASIRIPLSTRSHDVPASVPLYHFDQPAGVWIEEGTATLGGSAGARYYEGTVTHFTTWNADQVYSTIYVNGCVVDQAGVRVADALVSTDGISYSGTSSGYTNASGDFSVPMMSNGVATLLGYSNDLFSNTLSVGPSTADITLTDCLTLAERGAGATIKLTWGEAPNDLDSHLTAPNGAHVYYSSKGSLAAAPFANLDVDDTSSFGPEVVTLSRMMVGTYTYSVRNYSGQYAGMLSASGARVELNVFGQPLQFFVAGAGDDSSTDWWNVFQFTVDAHCNVTVTRTDAYGTSMPAPAPVAETYCTP